MHAHNWILWLLLTAIVVLPVILRLLVGDEPPGNALRQEQYGAGAGDHDPAVQEQPAVGGEFRLVA